jgi:aminopeptidase N
VKDEYLTGQSFDGKEICLQTLGQLKLPEAVNNFLEFNFSGTVTTQDVHRGAKSLALNPKARGLQWEWIKKNWDKVYERLSVNFTILGRFLRFSLRKFSDHKVEQDIAAFFKEKDNSGYDQALRVILDTVRGNANYKQRDEALVLEWLKAHDYA